MTFLPLTASNFLTLRQSSFLSNFSVTKIYVQETEMFVCLEVWQNVSIFWQQCTFSSAHIIGTAIVWREKIPITWSLNDLWWVNGYFQTKMYLLDDFLPNRSLWTLRTHKKEMTEWWEFTNGKGHWKSESNGGFSSCPKNVPKSSSMYHKLKITIALKFSSKMQMILLMLNV